MFKMKLNESKFFIVRSKTMHTRKIMFYKWAGYGRTFCSEIERAEEFETEKSAMQELKGCDRLDNEEHQVIDIRELTQIAWIADVFDEKVRKMRVLKSEELRGYYGEDGKMNPWHCAFVSKAAALECFLEYLKEAVKDEQTQMRYHQEQIDSHKETMKHLKEQIKKGKK